MTIESKIEAAVEVLVGLNRPVTPVWIMWEVLNTSTDEEIHELGSDIVDIAEKVEYYFAKRTK